MAKLVEIDLDPDSKTLRQFGFIAFFGFGVLAALAYYEKLLFSFGLGEVRIPLAIGFLLLGTLAAAFSLIVPRANRVLYVGLTLVAFPIGFIVSHAIMAVLFFVVIGPIALILRLFGRDSLDRVYDRDAPTYWSDARPPRDKESYFHQY